MFGQEIIINETTPNNARRNFHMQRVCWGSGLQLKGVSIDRERDCAACSKFLLMFWDEPKPGEISTGQCTVAHGVSCDCLVVFMVNLCWCSIQWGFGELRLSSEKTLHFYVNFPSREEWINEARLAQMVEIGEVRGQPKMRKSELKVRLSKSYLWWECERQATLQQKIPKGRENSNE